MSKKNKLRVSETSKMIADEIRRELAKREKEEKKRKMKHN